MSSTESQVANVGELLSLQKGAYLKWNCKRIESFRVSVFPCCEWISGIAASHILVAGELPVIDWITSPKLELIKLIKLNLIKNQLKPGYFNVFNFP